MVPKGAPGASALCTGGKWANTNTNTDANTNTKTDTQTKTKTITNTNTDTWVVSRAAPWATVHWTNCCQKRGLMTVFSIGIGIENGNVIGRWCQEQRQGATGHWTYCWLDEESIPIP